MKRSILLAIVGLTGAVATSAYGQGTMRLGNYISSSNIPSPVLWTAGGSPVNVSGYTVGFYFAAGDIRGSVASDPDGLGGGFWGDLLPTSLYSGFQLATGSGSTAAVAGANVFGYPGAYSQGSSFQPGLGAGATITVMLVAYNGANYLTSSMRGHSSAFTMVTAVGNAFPQLTGIQETDGGFALMVPEPTTLALGGLGLAALLFFRRKEA
jgi:hypothetical protein